MASGSISCVVVVFVELCCILYVFYAIVENHSDRHSYVLLDAVDHLYVDEHAFNMGGYYTSSSSNSNSKDSSSEQHADPWLSLLQQQQQKRYQQHQSSEQPHDDYYALLSALLFSEQQNSNSMKLYRYSNELFYLHLLSSSSGAPHDGTAFLLTVPLLFHNTSISSDGASLLNGITISLSLVQYLQCIYSRIWPFFLLFVNSSHLFICSCICTSSCRLVLP